MIFIVKNIKEFSLRSIVPEDYRDSRFLVLCEGNKYEGSSSSVDGEAPRWIYIRKYIISQT